MCALESKNQIAWSEIDNQVHFVDRILKEGEFDIAAETIKKLSAREPRLMAKYDHAINRPHIFKTNGINILPITSDKYKLLAFNSFASVAYAEESSSLNSKLGKYQTIDLGHINSEDKSIIVADISGILSSFTGENDLRLTNKGKFGVGQFSFVVNKSDGTSHMVNVSGSGGELDAGFEGDKFYVIEAKLGKVEDFNIRQLYYPYRFWEERIDKEVVPLFFTYSDGTFSIWQYRFEDKMRFNDIHLVKHRNYVLDESELLRDADFLDIKEFRPSDPPGIPFPQADDFEKVINLVELVGSGINTKEEFANNFSFDMRQSDYYFNAARYLNLVEKQDTQIRLTKLGESVLASSRRARHLILIKAILSRKIFFDIYIAMKEKDTVSDEKILKLVKQNRVLLDSKESTILRRIQTVISWCRWILARVEH